MVGSQVDIGGGAGGAKWRVGLTLALVLELAVTAATAACNDTNRHVKHYPHGAVASNGYECASIGRYVWRGCLGPVLEFSEFNGWVLFSTFFYQYHSVIYLPMDTWNEWSKDPSEY